ANIMRQPCDILLLDEPTNDLDILSLEVLEQSIREFPGAVIIVSHDRYLMDNVCHRMLFLDKHQPAAFYKNFDQILKAKAGAAKAEQATKSKAADTRAEKKTARKKSKSGPALSYKDKYELAHIEQKIMDAETVAAELTEKVQAPDVVCDPARLTEICAQLEAAESKVQALYARWEILEAKKEAAEKG
ncbi:MAG: toluene ABC transporter ATP-binding protein, partial [Desulfobacterales bacterium]